MDAVVLLAYVNSECTALECNFPSKGILNTFKERNINFLSRFYPLCMEPLCATILVLVVTSRDIILAADSRKTHLYPDGIEEAGTMDKIHQTSGYYYASAGLSSCEVGQFNIHEILHSILSQYSSFDQAVKQITARLSVALKEFFVNMKKNRSALLAQYQKSSGAGGEIFIVKRVNSVPVAYLLDYKVLDSASVNIVLNTWTINISDVGSGAACFWRAVGHTSFPNGQWPSEKEMAEHPVTKAQWIIQEGIKKYPTLVGAPITILEMNATGVRCYKV